MPSTYSRLLYHIVFATKHRAPLIAPDWSARLHAYLGATIHGLDGVPYAIGGVTDHVHLLIGLKPTHCITDVVRETKKATSVWVTEHIDCPTFRWQEGYGAFTVSASMQSAVESYIAHQDEHHRQQTFREELVELLAKAGVNYDERYLD